MTELETSIPVHTPQEDIATTANVSIVTVTYRAAGFINDFLIAACKLLELNSNLSLVLVDNQSPDNTVELINTFIDKSPVKSRITFCAEKGNHGFGKGCNIGAANAIETFNPDYFWFLNPDTKITQENYIPLISFSKRKPHADFIGSSLKDELGKQHAGAFRFPSIKNTISQQLSLKLFDRMFPNSTTAYQIFDTPHKADWLTGASFLAKRSSFNKLGGFDEKFFLYFEEVDLFYRAKQLNMESWSCPDSCVFHISGASTGMNNAKLESKQRKPRPKFWFESRRYFYLKNYGRSYFAITDLCFLLCREISKIKFFIKGQPSTQPIIRFSDILKHSALF